MKEHVIVVYYDGNENRVAKCETEFPNSSMPHVFGLPNDSMIHAVIAGPGLDVDRVNVYIDEEEQLGNGE